MQPSIPSHPKTLNLFNVIYNQMSRDFINAQICYHMQVYSKVRNKLDD